MMNGEVPESRVDQELNLVGSFVFEAPGDAELREQVFAELTGREISNPDLRRVFEIARTMHGAGEPLNDPALWVERMKAAGIKDSAAVELLQRMMRAVPYAIHMRRYAAIVAAEHRRDELVNVGQRLAAEAKDRTTEPDSIIQGTLQQLEAIRGAGAGNSLIDAAGALKAFDERRDSVAAIRTGFSELDKLLSGGFREGQLVVVGGRPGSGKSALMQQVAMINAGDGSPAFYISLEMGSAELAGRGVRAMGRERFARLPIWFAESGDLAKIVAESRLAVRRHGVKLICVDYLQLIENSPRSRNTVREQEVAAISRGLKLLAKEMGVVVLSGSQLSRAAAAKDRPGLADLRESGAIEQDADIAILLKASDDDGGGVKEVEASLQKHRNGPVGAVNLRFDGKRFTFSENSGGDSEAWKWAENFAGGGRR
jgi:replicative DNA helicase